MTTARERAWELLGPLLEERRPATTAEDDATPLDGREARFAAELAHGVVRHRTRVDWVIAHAARKPVDHIAPPALDALRIGVYQLLYTPHVPRYAAVSESVALARRHAPKAAGFVNWLLRRIGPEYAALPRREDFRDPVARLATLHSFPPWLVRRWVKRLGEEEADLLCAAMNRHPQPHLRVNRTRAAPEAVREELAAAGFEAVPGRYAPSALHVSGPGRITETAPFAAGAVYLQDESSQLAALLLAPLPGERVLDACAGLGGKTTQLADLAGGAATILALDPDAGRLRRLGENLGRLGLPGVTALAGDLLDPACLAGELFDAVLVDAPCSGLGTIPRHPEVKWAKRSSDSRRLAALQGRLLDRAAALVGPGGRIVFSACTTEPEEGEELMGAFLARHPGFAVEPPPDDGAIAHVGELRTDGGFLRTWPHRHGVEASFAARVRRAGSPPPGDP